MAVAKWKQEYDRKIRQAGGKVVSGRVYDADGKFWGPRMDFYMLPATLQDQYLKQWAKRAREIRVAAKGKTT